MRTTGLQGHASALPCVGRAHSPVVDRGRGRGRGEGGHPRCATAAAARHLAGGRPARQGRTLRPHTRRGGREREAARHTEPALPAAGAHGHAQRREAAAFGARRNATTSGERGRGREEGEATGAREGER